MHTLVRGAIALALTASAVMLLARGHWPYAVSLGVIAWVVWGSRIPIGGVPRQTFPPSVSPELGAEVRRLVRTGLRDEAVALVRDRLHLTVERAEEAVERIATASFSGDPER